METPEHYRGKMDVIDLLVKARGKTHAVLFCLDNVLKYATRMTRKEQLLSDLGKIKVYTRRALNLYDDHSNEETYKIAAIQTEHYDRTIRFLEGQFGKLFTLDYIQGEIIRITTDEIYKNIEKELFDEVLIVRLSRIIKLVVEYENLLLEECEEYEECEEEEDVVESISDEVSKAASKIVEEVMESFAGPIQEAKKILDQFNKIK